MPAFNEKKFIEVCEEIAETCDCKDGYCFFRNLVTHQRPSLRNLIQIECIEKLKWEQSQREGQDIGTEGAAMLWSTTEYAIAYAEVYSEDKSVKQIYKETMIRAKELQADKKS